MGKFRRITATVVASVMTAATAGLIAPPAAKAVPQAGGNDLSGWATNWRWTYNRTFQYAGADGTTANVNEVVNYINAGPVTKFGQPAWQLNITGNVTGGNANAQGNNVNITGGSITGTRFVRQSDLAEIETHEVQTFSGTGPFGVAVTATFDATITPSPSWRTKDFRLHAGDTWQVNETINTAGTFSYNAGIGGSGSGPLDSSTAFNTTATVAAETLNLPIAAGVVTDRVTMTAGNGSEQFEWWAPAYRNDGRTHTKSVSGDGSVLTLDANLASVLLTAPAVAVTETISPNLVCGGGQFTVSGALGTGQSGQPVSISLDQSILTPGQAITTSTTTGAGGAYSATMTAPLQPDGLSKADARAGWGIIVTIAGAKQVATLEVRPENCTALGVHRGDQRPTSFDGDSQRAPHRHRRQPAGGRSDRDVLPFRPGGHRLRHHQRQRRRHRQPVGRRPAALGDDHRVVRRHTDAPGRGRHLAVHRHEGPDASVGQFLQSLIHGG